MRKWAWTQCKTRNLRSHFGLLGEVTLGCAGANWVDNLRFPREHKNYRQFPSINAR